MVVVWGESFIGLRAPGRQVPESATGLGVDLWSRAPPLPAGEVEPPRESPRWGVWADTAVALHSTSPRAWLCPPGETLFWKGGGVPLPTVAATV